MYGIRQTSTYKRWFTALKDRKVRTRIDVRIRRLSLGNPGDVKPVGQGVSELRINFGPSYRVYFIQKRNVIVILLMGGSKATQSEDIRKAHLLARQIEEIN
jgi:putative addiction module killer protein